MPDYKTIYTEHAAEYERLTQCEDYRGKLLPTLDEIHPLDGAEVIEFGAGTGRVTRLLSPVVRRVHAFDLHRPMIDVAADVLRQSGTCNWLAGVADNRAMPVAGGCADIAIEGWSFCQIMAWNMETWRVDAGRAIDEMLRVIRPGGTAILIETLGTGTPTPNPPADWFSTFYDYLEDERGFSVTWIRTDFRFESLDEARELTGLFFGDYMQGMTFIQEEDHVILPECTGIWWLIR